MNRLEKFLRYSQKLEELQTERKAKEVDEIRKFDIQIKSHKQRESDQMTEFAQIYMDWQNQRINEPLADEQQRQDRQLRDLEELRQFEEYAYNTSQYGTDNPFDLIAEMEHDSGIEHAHEEIKQITAGTPDAFDHELTECTEIHLQQELEQNEIIVKKDVPIEEPKPTGLFFRSTPFTR